MRKTGNVTVPLLVRSNSAMASIILLSNSSLVIFSTIDRVSSVFFTTWWGGSTHAPHDENSSAYHPQGQLTYPLPTHLIPDFLLIDIEKAINHLGCALREFTIVHQVCGSGLQIHQ